MSVAVAHQASASGRLILQEAAKEASLRQTAMSVLHIAEGVDIDSDRRSEGTPPRRDRAGPGRSQSAPMSSGRWK